MSHQERVVGHVSGRKEHMGVCVCGQSWPCPIANAAEALVRNGDLNAESLQTIIDSPNFRDYEKAMAQEIQRLRAVVSRTK